MMAVKQLICADGCTVGACHPKCALDVVDELLSTPGAVTGDEVDLLLDFRSLLRARREAETALRVFCDLRRRLEQRHYLAFYRLRRWLENQIAAEVRSPVSAEAVRVPLRLDFYCVEAVRRASLCAALKHGAPFSALRLQFTFLPVAAPAHAAASHIFIPA
jgi:hypothetical protein